MSDPALLDGSHAKFHPLAPDRDPWERQPGESAKAHNAFLIYRDQGPANRSVRAVGRGLGKSRALVERWSAAWQWVFRVEQWDARETALRAQSLREKIDQMLERHRAVAFAGLAKVIQRLVGDPKTGVRALDANTLEPQHLAYMARMFATLEREATDPEARRSSARIEVSADKALEVRVVYADEKLPGSGGNGDEPARVLQGADRGRGNGDPESVP